MITSFKIYESTSLYKGKFFFRPTNRSINHGNLCLCLGVYTTHQPGKDYQIDVVNVGYHKARKRMYISNPSKSVVQTKTLVYSEKTFNRLKFLTVDELYELDSKLTMNIFNKAREYRYPEHGFTSTSIEELYDALSMMYSVVQSLERIGGEND